MTETPSNQPKGARGSSEDMPSYFHTKYGEKANTPIVKPQGKKIIESKIGNSQESPSYFRTAHGTISPDTYNNPYIQVKAKAFVPNSPDTPMKNKQTFSIFNKLSEDQKKDFFYIKEVPIPSVYNLVTHQRKQMGKMDLQINERAKFNEDYKSVQQQAPTPFHRKTDYFSDFVERNDVMNVFGGLNTRERLTQFCKVKDYSLDETQLSLVKSVRENSQPSRFWQNNRSVIKLGDASKINSNTHLQEQLSNTNILSSNQIQNQRESKGFQPAQGQYLIPSDYPFNSKGSLLAEENDQSKTFKLPTVNQSLPTINQSNRYNTEYGTFTSKNKSKVFAQYARVSLGAKTPMKIPQIKFDLEKSEEAAKELQCIDEFEEHLKFIQGNDSGGSKMGSVFFKDSKR